MIEYSDLSMYQINKTSQILRDKNIFDQSLQYNTADTICNVISLNLKFTAKNTPLDISKLSE